jgi:hypothetical protein
MKAGVVGLSVVIRIYLRPDQESFWIWDHNKGLLFNRVKPEQRCASGQSPCQKGVDPRHLRCGNIRDWRFSGFSGLQKIWRKIEQDRQLKIRIWKLEKTIKASNVGGPFVVLHGNAVEKFYCIVIGAMLDHAGRRELRCGITCTGGQCVDIGAGISNLSQYDECIGGSHIYFTQKGALFQPTISHSLIKYTF